VNNNKRTGALLTAHQHGNAEEAGSCRDD